MGFAAAAQAAIVGINAPVSSNALIYFDDTNSIAPPPGVTNTSVTTSPWNGSPVALPPTVDPVTGDFAMGGMDAVFSGNAYMINFNNITLAQNPANSGFAELGFRFYVEYQLDASGLPAQPTLYPNFLVNGTVQPIPGSFALLNGFIDYYGVTVFGPATLIETVTYTGIWTSWGPFTAMVSGSPVNGTTPALMPNTTLTLTGYIQFIVDPASINAQSVPVPEPASGGLLAVGLAGVALGVRRFWSP
jgi:hypothetical protein